MASSIRFGRGGILSEPKRRGGAAPIKLNVVSIEC
jgi:hypothetical protein